MISDTTKNRWFPFLIRVYLLAQFLKFRLSLTGEISFVSLVQGSLLIGAGDDAISAADAFILVNPDYPIGTLRGASGRTNLNADGVMAVHA